MSVTGLKKLAVLMILYHQDQLLLLERFKPPHQGALVPVGGKIDPFETPSQAALRETHEETGLSLKATEFCGTMVESSPVDYNWVCFIYKAEIERVKPPPCQEGILRWVPRKTLDEVNIPQTDSFIYDYAFEEKPFFLEVTYDKTLSILSMEEAFQKKCLLKR